MQPPESNIIRDHPRKFMLGAVVVGVAGMNPVLAVAMLGVLGYAFMCWIDEDRFLAAQEQEWKRFDQRLAARSGTPK